MGDVVRLNACLSTLGGVVLHTFRDRKVLQKRIYFLQEFGLDLGYDFGWYIYGPYSSELANDAFNLLQQKREAPNTVEGYSLSPEERSAIRRLRNFLEKRDLLRNVAESGYTLELLSSLHYLFKVSYWKAKTKESITAKLKEQKRGRFNDKDIKMAWEILENSGLVAFGE